MAEVVWVAVTRPTAARAHAPAFGRHDDAAGVSGVGREGFTKKPLVVVFVGLVAAVGVGGVDEGDTEVEDAMEDVEALRLRRPLRQRKVHRAESDGGDGEGGVAEGGGSHE